MNDTVNKSDEKQITGAASTIAGATFISRILGYLRDAVIAYVFGAGMSADAFFVAFRVANFLRRLAGEGALTSAFIPVFTDVLKERSKKEARAFVSSFFTLLVIILIVLTVIGIVFSDYIVMAMASGFAGEPGKFSLTVSLTRLMFPYLFFISLMAAAMGVLNTLRHFAAPALSPVLLNISMILCAVLVAPMLGVPVYALAIGVLIGGVLQFAVLLPFLKKFSMMPGFSLRFGDPAIKKFFLLMGPAVFGLGIYQLITLVITHFASLQVQGSVSYLYYGGRLMELPLGMFGVAIMQATLPSLSEHASKSDYSSFNNSLSFSLRMVNFVSIPATVGLMVLGLPIVKLLFVRGEFGIADASGTAYALYFFALGIVPIALSRQLVSVFYALKDTVTPVKGAAMALVTTVIFCLLLQGPMSFAGLALAASLAATANLAYLYLKLSARLDGFSLSLIAPSALKSLVSALIMGLCIYVLSEYFGLSQAGTGLSVILVALFVAGGAGLYFVVCTVLKTSEVSFLKGVIATKLGRLGSGKGSK